LVVLGVILTAIVAMVALVIARRRWVRRQRGAFAGAIRVFNGEIGEPSGRGRRGRSVRDVLVWTKGPFLLRNELLPIDDLDESRSADPAELGRLGPRRRVIWVRSGSASVEVSLSPRTTHRP
jgi:hypothetical protein